MRSLILLFGEDDNDIRSLAILCRALAPEGSEVDTRVIKKPLILSANAAPKKKQAMANTIAEFARAEEKRYDRVIVVTHRDCDQCEPAHEKQSKELHDALLASGVKFPVPATPAWEIETWWMAFPDEVEMTRACWRRLNYGVVSLGEIEHAKERLIRDLRPTKAADRVKCRDYRESDSITIVENISKRNPQLKSQNLRPKSLDDFRNRLQAALV